jgi:hypothetical protein
VEQENGAWLFRRGRTDIKQFGQLGDALEHTTDIASEHPPSEVIVHRLDGRVEVIATFE